MRAFSQICSCSADPRPPEKHLDVHNFVYLIHARVARSEPEVRDEMGTEKYLPELMAEKDTLDPSFQHSVRLLDQGKWPWLNTGVNTLAVWKLPPAAHCSGITLVLGCRLHDTSSRLLQVKNKRFVGLLTISCLVTPK